MTDWKVPQGWEFIRRNRDRTILQTRLRMAEFFCNPRALITV